MAQRSEQKSFVTNSLHILIPEYNQSNTPLVSDIKIRIALQLGEINRSFKEEMQGCALAEPCGPWHLTFALGRLGNLRFFIQIICWAPQILQDQKHWAPYNFPQSTTLRCISNCLPSAFCIIGSSESFYASSPDIYQPGMHAFQTVTSYYHQKYNYYLGLLSKNTVSNIFIWDTKSIYLTRNPLHRCKQSKPVLKSYNLNYSSTDLTFGSALYIVKKRTQSF